ncbi:MAG TPA: sigma-70 family RNA polymerase sigma factor [Mycetocola sp.]|jgi:RNA polymerase sigma-70 factor (ECF subfamily)|uniref:sigma-70 family RNA polymerase sigma factor n=1 Tax=Mycetocola sp. TaxID=1871042 RepID=UPI0026167EBA|nr:sigma-70 family RNA polymerase sigma factor [Mycetocola sp.]MCU1560572.1 polymerase subunit sigma [Mycetocola sp.]HEV7848438.1 sigma-70 family RNA polymerase sigma factor [Mycetocola sp.]
MSTEHAELLRALHDEHWAALTRFVYHLTGDSALAEDVVQETLFRAWKHPDILEQNAGSARAWLFAVARNLVIDDRRSAHHRHELATGVVPERSSPDGIDGILDAWLVSDALTSLSEDHRLVLVHTYYLGRSVAETADELGVPPGTVKSRMHYALRALRLALQERGVTQ